MALTGFRSLAKIGAGSQKIVFRAERNDGNVCAVKLYPVDTVQRGSRAEREIQAITAVTGPQFATFHGMRRLPIEGVEFVVIEEEFIDGDTLKSRMSGTPLPISFVRHLGGQLLEALRVIEACRLVHRDIKPDNVMISSADRVVVIDFGIVRHLDESSLTATWAPRGPMTLAYAAPEQVSNDKAAIAIRTDLYAMGLVLYEAATGFNPITTGVSRDTIPGRILTHSPEELARVRPDVPAEFSRFVHRLVEKQAHRRPQTVQAARQLFDRIQWSSL
ncbi:serine/threonine-protein kinase [Limnoglobus roseus]|nr:serine/threonine-protein kinase [Limnoglobus roseus]